MPPKSNVPVRIGGSKVRTGCKTCKRRHVKCDERPSVCLRCEKANLIDTCVYETLPARQPQVGDRSISPYGPREVTEISAMKRFAMHLGPELAGCFSDYVWCEILPKVAQNEQVVWDAVVAVSMLDTSIRLGHSASPAIRQYDKAIQELRRRLDCPRESQRRYQDVVLLCCLLFTIFECLQNRFTTALHHISGGTKLLREWESDEAQDNDQAFLCRASLQPIFLSLDSQAVHMGVVGFRELHSLPAIGQPQHPHPPLAPFVTVQEAHLKLNQIFNRITRWAIWIEPSTAVGTRPDDTWMTLERERLRIQLTEWDSAFEPLLISFSPQPAIFLPLFLRKTIQIYFDSQAHKPSEMRWDNFNPLFQEAFQCAEAYMGVWPGSTVASVASDSERKRPVFTVAMDIVLPLFLIVRRCRDAGLRRRALAMLKGCGHKEGIWDAYLCAGLCEKMIESEERGALEDGTIPESARIYDIDVWFGEEKWVEIIYKKRVGDGDTRCIEKGKEIMAW